MRRKEIEFTIDGNGDILSIIKGMKGSACSSIAEAIKSLGHVEEESRTNEYFEKERTNLIIHGTTEEK